MQPVEKPKRNRLFATVAVTAIVCLLIGGILGYALNNFATSSQISKLQSDQSTLQAQVSTLQTNQSNLQSQIAALQSQLQNQNSSSVQNATYVNSTYTNYIFGDNASLSQLYGNVKNSIVVIQGLIAEYGFFGELIGYGTVQGSGFVANSSGRLVIVTNFHVVDGAINITVTFFDGNTYFANVTGTDPHADLAVVTSNAPTDEYVPLTITNSSSLKVGDPVVAIGTPYGLAGTVTTGIVSALGRTITESSTTGDTIADCIQTTTAINPGNSGGPLLNYAGEVIGITTAIVSSSQGLGFAIPSESILREISALITNGTYNNHPSLGIDGTDMSLAIAQAMNTSVTYGFLVTQVISGGPADKAGLHAGTNQVQIAGSTVTIGGDIIISINGSRIRNTDDLLSYLEQNTLPSQTISITVVRNNQMLTVPATVGTL